MTNGQSFIVVVNHVVTVFPHGITIPVQLHQFGKQSVEAPYAIESLGRGNSTQDVPAREKVGITEPLMVLPSMTCATS